MESIAMSILNMFNELKPYAFILLIGAICIGGFMLVFGRSGRALGISIILGGIVGFALIMGSEQLANWFADTLNF
ncbi:MAG: hypothetical protein KFW09_05300 [Oscillospiraceae bacterium]|nr:hypothetical protein [Oscillospiraceae bacterium]